jgi:hypothetical protein
MLEQHDVLLTWALASPPDTTGALDACRLDDHRVIYLDYEGEVSGGRGSVTRWDQGDYEMIGASDQRLCARVSGKRIQGDIELAQTASAEAWHFRYAPQAPVNPAP